MGRTFEIVHDVAQAAGRTPDIEALVQHVELTDDAGRAAARMADHIEGASGADLLAAPFVLIGTVEEIVAELRRHHDELGVTHYVVRAATIDAVAPIISALS